MKNYSVKIRLDSGDIVECEVAARNCSDAVARVRKSEDYIGYATGIGVKDVKASPLPLIPVSNVRYNVRAIDNKHGWYVAEDSATGVKIEWKRGMFNDTQHVIYEGEATDALALASAIRGIADHLAEFFRSLV